MKAFIFARYSLGDKVLLELVQKNLKCENELLGESVDLSRIKPEEENLIIIINPSIYKLDFDKVLGYINKDKTKPLVVFKKRKTFGAVFLNPNKEIEKITTNKVFLFSGIMYLPKKYFRTRVSEIFRNLDDNKKDVRAYIV